MTSKLDGHIFEYDNLCHVLYDPIKLRGFVPEKGSELYVSKIPNTTTIYELLHFFEQVGRVFRVKLLMKQSGKSPIHLNRGYGFVMYHNKILAEKAINDLDKVCFQLRYLKIEKSFDTCRIYLSGIPVQKSKPEIWAELQRFYPRVPIANLIVHRDDGNEHCNRGYVFFDLSTHEEALSFVTQFPNGLNLFGSKIKVDWNAKNKLPDEKDLAQVKTLCIRNLNKHLDPNEYGRSINDLISRCFIEKIYQKGDDSYIYLTTRLHAQLLLNKLKGYFAGTSVEVCFSTPPNEFSNEQYRRGVIAERRSETRRCALGSAIASTSTNSLHAPTSTVEISSSSPQTGLETSTSTLHAPTYTFGSPFSSAPTILETPTNTYYASTTTFTSGSPSSSASTVWDTSTIALNAPTSTFGSSSSSQAVLETSTNTLHASTPAFGSSSLSAQTVLETATNTRHGSASTFGSPYSSAPTVLDMSIFYSYQEKDEYIFDNLERFPTFTFGSRSSSASTVWDTSTNAINAPTATFGSSSSPQAVLETSTNTLQASISAFGSSSLSAQTVLETATNTRPASTFGSPSSSAPTVLDKSILYSYEEKDEYIFDNLEGMVNTIIDELLSDS